MPYGARLELLKKSVLGYIENQVRNCKAFNHEPGDLKIINGSLYQRGKAIDAKLSAQNIVWLCDLADKIHFRPLGGAGKIIGIKESFIEKSDNMNFEIKNDIPLPPKAAEKLEPKGKVAKTKSGRINYSNLPLRAMKKGDCIVLFEQVMEEKISSKKHTALTGIRRISNIMGLPNSFHVDTLGDKICVWRIA